MKKRDLIFAAICIVVVAGLIYLSIKGRYGQPTYRSVPQHKELKDLTPRAKCLECHDPQTGINEVDKRLPATHPEKWKDEKFSCLKCHGFKDSPNNK